MRPASACGCWTATSQIATRAEPLAEIRFYHLQRQSLEQALPRLLEKVLAAGFKAVVRTATPARVDQLDQLLWTYDPASFLPHGTPKSGFADRQPVYLTAGDDVPNDAGVLILVDGTAPPEDLGRFERCLLMFNGGDEEAVATARRRWKSWKDAGLEVSYWQQRAEGGWEQKA